MISVSSPVPLWPGKALLFLSLTLLFHTTLSFAEDITTSQERQDKQVTSDSSPEVTSQETDFQRRLKASSKELSTSGELPNFQSLAGKVLKGLLYCVALVLILASVFKKLNKQPGSQNPDSIKVIGRKHLSPRNSLLVVEIDNKKLLLSESQDGLRFIANLDIAGTTSEKVSPSPVITKGKDNG